MVSGTWDGSQAPIAACSESALSTRCETATTLDENEEVVVFVLIGTSTIYTPVLLAQFVPERSGPARAQLRVWLERRWANVGSALLLLVGVALIVTGLLALT